MGKLVVTIVAEISVPDEDLKFYDASDIHEAAADQARGLDEGECGVDDLVSGCVSSVTIVGVE